MRIFTTPAEIATFMQNIYGETTIKGNQIFLYGKKIGELRFGRKIKGGLK